MGTNTEGVLQMFSKVPAGQPNEGSDAVEDAATIHTRIVREQAVLNINASDINTNLGVLDVSTARTINITMDANITDFDLTGLNALLNVSGDAIDAEGMWTIINFIQDAVGNRTVTTKSVGSGGKIVFGTSFGTFALSGTALKKDKTALSFRKVTDVYEASAFEKGY